MSNKHHALPAALAAAIVAADIMLILGILGNLGLYLGAVQAMQQWHMFFDLSVAGIIAGIIEGAAITFVIVYAFVWLYEKLSSKLNK